MKPRTRKELRKTRKVTTQWTGYAINNAYGGLWSHKVFESAEEARQYIKMYEDNFPVPIDLSKHSIIPVHILSLPSKKKVTKTPHART